MTKNNTLFLSPATSFYLLALSKHEVPVICLELKGTMGPERQLTDRAAPYRYPTKPDFEIVVLHHNGCWAFNLFWYHRLANVSLSMRWIV